MPVHGTNRTNLASVESAIVTLKNNAALGSGDAKAELVKLCKTLEREIDRGKRSIQNLP